MSKRKLTYEKRIAVINDYKKGKGSYETIAVAHGVCPHKQEILREVLNNQLLDLQSKISIRLMKSLELSDGLILTYPLKLYINMQKADKCNSVRIILETHKNTTEETPVVFFYYSLSMNEKKNQT